MFPGPPAPTKIQNPEHKNGVGSGDVGSSVGLVVNIVNSASGVRAANGLLDFDVVFRNLHQHDEHFVLNSWMKSLRQWRMWIDNAAFYKHYDYAIKRMFIHADWIIACDNEDPAQIFGWTCFQKPVCHYVFVKQVFRNFGIGRELLKQTGCEFFSHWTRRGHPPPNYIGFL